MIQNLKIDIIYYDTPSDFEFEFNLGGCCHSRVLNSKTSSPKEMIGCLSKAVARSRVILIIGKLDGSDGLFSLVSKAISLPLTPVNAEEYGIIAGTDNNIIANSLPLISTDGVLAGCIIESGPQSIILLPGAKFLRKDVAENLVFQYITAVSRTPDTETVVTPDSVAEDMPAVSGEKETAEEPITEEPVTAEAQLSDILDEPDDFLTEIPNQEPQEDLLYENGETAAESVTEIFAENEEASKQEEFIDIYTDSSHSEESAEIDDNYVYNNYDPNDYDDTEDDESFDDESYNDNKKTVRGINTFIWIIVGLMLIIAALLIYMLVYTPLSGDTDVIKYIGQVLNP